MKERRTVQSKGKYVMTWSSLPAIIGMALGVIVTIAIGAILLWLPAEENIWRAFGMSTILTVAGIVFLLSRIRGHPPER